MSYIEFLPKAIDYKTERYYLKTIHLEDSKSLSNSEVELIKIYYRSKKGILTICTENFCKEGCLYQVVYDMLVLIERYLSVLVITSENLPSTAEYTLMVSNMINSLNDLELNIKNGGFKNI